jgi:hypothetical protein
MTTTALEKTAKSTAPQGPKPYRLIKLGIDVHWREYVVVRAGVVVRQIDGASPQPAQKFTPDGFIAWVAKQCKLADQVCCCYEAGTLRVRPAQMAGQAGSAQLGRAPARHAIETTTARG